MRKIESQMNQAIKDCIDWSSGNTRVEYEQGNEISKVFLHGNLIAEVGDGFIKLYDGGWQSNTTKSRLNALLVENGEKGDRVFQSNFEWFLSMNTVQGITTVPCFSSMRLA